MFNFPKLVFVTALWAVTIAVSAQGTIKYPSVGRDATPKEVAAWDIDVRPDFKGLPAGAGSVAKGQVVWESKCASCHGVFGESGEVFSPLVGGTTAADIKSGRVASLTDAAYPGRTTLMKVPTLSTLWDYINRAMPWNAPKSLSTEEVYAVTAFLLNLGGVLPDHYVLSDKNIREVQERMPNRNGMTTQHALWPGQEFVSPRIKPDTSNVACMRNCASEAVVASHIPDYARNAHGNLAEQNRLVGSQHGVDTTQPEKRKGSTATNPARSVADLPKVAGLDGRSKVALALAQQHSCTACHSVDRRLVGPSFQEIGKRYPGKAGYLTEKIKMGSSGLWGAIPMPAQSLGDEEASTLGTWLASGVIN